MRFEEYSLFGAAVETQRRGEAAKGLFVKHVPPDLSHLEDHKKPLRAKPGVITGNIAEFSPGKWIPTTGYHTAEQFLRNKLRFRDNQPHPRMLKDLIHEVGLDVRYRAAKVYDEGAKDYWDPPNYTIWHAYVEALANVLRTADKHPLSRDWKWWESKEDIKKFLYAAVRDEGRRIVIERVEDDFRAWGHEKREASRKNPPP